MTTVTVATSAALSTALSQAAAGDTILLAPGSYGSISLSNLHFATDVTIASQYASAPAVLTGLNLSASNGLTFSGLEFNVATFSGAPAPFIVYGSSDIHFAGLHVHGSLDGNPGDDGAGLLIRNSTDVSVVHSEFEQLSSALGHLNDSYLTFSGNTFHDIRSDGILGGGSSNVVIQGNYFTDFYPAATDHADAIQFWTTNTTTSAHDIVIRENVLMRGAGYSNVQGIFVGDEVGTLPYQRLTIADNLVVGGGYNGIMINHATSPVVSGNIVSGYTDYESWIRFMNVSGGTSSGNEANAYIIDKTVANLTEIGDLLIGRVTDGGAALYKAWLALHPDAFTSSSTATTTTTTTTTSTTTTTTSSSTTSTGGLSGTSGNDVLNGTSGADYISGLGGNDTISGGGGADTLLGGDGADRLVGGAGADYVDGGAGSDSYIVTGGDKVVESVSGAAGGVDSVYSYESFTLGANVENLRFGGDASLKGVGNELGNVLEGNGANDWMEGRAGADTISTGYGADTLIGGQGADLLTGGAGADRFVFAKGDGADRITDFGYGGAHDVLDLSALYSAGLKATLVDSAAGVTLTFASGDSIFLQGVHPGSLHATSTGFVF